MYISRLLALPFLIAAYVMPQAAQVSCPPGCAIMLGGPAPGNVRLDDPFAFIKFTHPRAKCSGQDPWNGLSQNSPSLHYLQSQLPSHNDGVKRAHLDFACVTAPPEFRFTPADKFPAPSLGP
jgi:hypothetical protein